MAYNNKVTEAEIAVTVVLFLAVAIAPQWTEAQPMPEMDPICAVAIPEIVKHCYAKISVLPTEECCKDLKTASKREVTCLCDNLIANPQPLFANITIVYLTK
ncbi:unnamed protein product [Arabis nemorensis]|uniref:Bifunctional inhibitor/plant lipid transfer protein/seed storage helical domain-containing protein n=1 Tax=Arabis nemorensis TaxID=586526 RepID=A0A565CEV1_9BRAS|nr:unnamed protein product [Arabis nemorensis]